MTTSATSSSLPSHDRTSTLNRFGIQRWIPSLATATSTHPHRARKLPASIFLTLLTTAILISTLLYTSLTSSRLSLSLPWSSPNNRIEPSDAPRGKTKLHLLFPINEGHHSATSCRVFAGAIVNGYEPWVFDWEIERDSGWAYQVAKVQGLYDLLTENATLFASSEVQRDAEDHLILMADATDVWFQLPPSAIIARYHEVQARQVSEADGGERLVIAADPVCWPNARDSDACTKMPPSTISKEMWGVVPEHGGNKEPPRFANSGMVLGRLEEMRAVMKEVLDMLAVPRRDVILSDQGPFNDLLQTGRVLADHEFALMWPMVTDVPNGAVINTRDPSLVQLSNTSGQADLVPWDLNPPLVWHRRTGVVPAMLHFNSMLIKDLMGKWWGAKGEDKQGMGGPWWVRGEERFKVLVEERLKGGWVGMVHDGSRRSFVELCPPEMLAA